MARRPLASRTTLRQAVSASRPPLPAPVRTPRPPAPAPRPYAPSSARDASAPPAARTRPAPAARPRTGRRRPRRSSPRRDNCGTGPARSTTGSGLARRRGRPRRSTGAQPRQRRPAVGAFRPPAPSGRRPLPPPAASAAWAAAGDRAWPSKVLTNPGPPAPGSDRVPSDRRGHPRPRGCTRSRSPSRGWPARLVPRSGPARHAGLGISIYAKIDPAALPRPRRDRYRVRWRRRWEPSRGMRRGETGGSWISGSIPSTPRKRRATRCCRSDGRH